MNKNNDKLRKDEADESLSERNYSTRYLLQSWNIKDSLTWNKQNFLGTSIVAGLQASVTMAIALTVAYFSAWSHLIGFAALGSLVAMFGRFAPQGERLGRLFYSALCQVSGVVLMSLAAYFGVYSTLQLSLLALFAGVFSFIAGAGKLGPPGAVIFVFAAGACMGQLDSIHVVVERAVAVSAAAILAVIICAITEKFRPFSTAERPFPESEDMLPRVAIIMASRIAFAAGVAVFASHQYGADHPTWAAIGAITVMQGTHLHINMTRAFQRMTGTMLGAMLAWLILMLEPSVLTVLGCLVVLQFSVELVIGSNYGLGQMLLTPMALLMTHLAAPHVVASVMATERVMDTLVGAAIGVIVAVIFSSLDGRKEIAKFSK